MTTKPKCDCCGKFVRYGCDVRFTPDTHFTIERIEYRCELCVKKHGLISKELIQLDFIQ